MLHRTWWKYRFIHLGRGTLGYVGTPRLVLKPERLLSEILHLNSLAHSLLVAATCVYPYRSWSRC